jgi:hypothetical protein
MSKNQRGGTNWTRQNAKARSTIEVGNLLRRLIVYR